MALICPECGIEFTKTGPRQVFCTDAHKRAFYKLMEKRGQTFMALYLTARKAGRYSGTDKELGAYARKTADALASLWVVDDNACGRAPEELVKNKRRVGWKAIDLTTKVDRRKTLQHAQAAR